MADHGNVVLISSHDDFKTQISKAKDEKKIVVIDFTATWCGPCRIIAPVFTELSKQYTNVVFLKVDVDDQKTVAQEYEVAAMPTFVFVKEGAPVDKIVGADKNALEAKVAQYASTT